MRHIIDPQLLYRFFFYGWLFRDASIGSLWERSAAWNHNREQCRWLPTYLRRWAALTALLFCAGSLCRLGGEANVAAACFTFVGVLTVPFHAVTAVCWCFLHGGWQGSAR